MAMAVEVDDDVFFADLSKQISLLIMDDDEDSSVSPTTSVSLEVFSQGIHPMMQTFRFVEEQNYYGKIQSKGTGVFIPQVSNPRRKNNSRQQGRHNSSNNSRFQRQFQNSSRGLLQPIPYNSSYDKFKL